MRIVDKKSVVNPEITAYFSPVKQEQEEQVVSCKRKRAEEETEEPEKEAKQRLIVPFKKRRKKVFNKVSIAKHNSLEGEIQHVYVNGIRADVWEFIYCSCCDNRGYKDKFGDYQCRRCFQSSDYLHTKDTHCVRELKRECMDVPSSLDGSDSDSDISSSDSEDSTPRFLTFVNNNKLVYEDEDDKPTENRDNDDSDSSSSSSDSDDDNENNTKPSWIGRKTKLRNKPKN